MPFLVLPNAIPVESASTIPPPTGSATFLECAGFAVMDDLAAMQGRNITGSLFYFGHVP